MIEVCVDSVVASKLAQQAGAQRVELNCALELDGLTPPAGLVSRVRETVELEVICMVRARAGDFVYSDDEWESMKSEIPRLLDLGVDGLAFGALDDVGGLNLERCAEFSDLARRRKPDCCLVFHKAFDETSDWRSALDQLVETGVSRIMTSGQAPNAMTGVPVLREMVEYARERIEILPAGGIRAENAAEIVARTGCTQVHGSFRSGKGKFTPTDEHQLLQQIRDTKAVFDR